MTARLARHLPPALGLLLLLATSVLPVAALVIRSLADLPAASQPSPLPQDFGAPLLPAGLLLRSVTLAAAAAGLALILAVPGAYVVGRLRELRSGGGTLALLVAPLLFPAMVYACGWQNVLRIPDAWRCVWVWASWAWPIPALILGAGWSRVGRPSYEQALLNAGPLRAFILAVLPNLAGPVVTSLLVLLALFLGDHGVPHACNLSLYATGLLSCAESSMRPIDTLAPSLPVVGVILLALALAAAIWRPAPPIEDQDAALTGLPTPLLLRLLPLLLVGLGIVAPVVRLATGVRIVFAVDMALRTYWVELLQSLGVALLAGLTAVGMGTALASSARLRRPALAWAVAVAALPGALVGEAVLTTYQSVPAVYDHWLLSVIGLLARFGWIGLGVGWLAHSAAARDLIAAARTDGAAESTISWRIALLPNWATLLTGVFVVAALSLSEVAVASLVRVPSLGNIALVLTEKMHRLDDDMIAAISLCLIAAALPGAALLALAARRRR